MADENTPAVVPDVKETTPDPKVEDKQPGRNLLAGEPEGEKKPEAKAEDPKKPEEKPSAEGDKKPEEKEAEIELKIPDGFDAPAEVLAEFKALAKEAGLKSEGAQKLIDLHVKREQARIDAEEAQRQKWQAEVKADPAYKDTLALAKRALIGVFDKEARELIETTLLGDNPSLIKSLAAVGRMMQDDKHVEGDSKKEADDRYILFPSTRPAQK